MTLYLNNTYPGWLLALAIVGACVAFALATTWVGRRAMRGRVQQGHNDVGGMILQIVGGVYAVLLALVVIALWEERSAIEECTASEASYLTAMYRDVGGLPPEFSASARAKIAEYTHAVVEVSYPALRLGKPSDAGRVTYGEMFTTIRSFEPKSVREQALWAEALRELNQSSEARTKRLASVRGGLPPVFWAVLLVSTGLTLALGGLLSMESGRHHYAFMIAFAASTGALLFLVLVLDRPFSGDFGVSPDAYEEALEAMRFTR